MFFHYFQKKDATLRRAVLSVYSVHSIFPSVLAKLVKRFISYVYTLIVILLVSDNDWQLRREDERYICTDIYILQRCRLPFQNAY